MKHLTAILMAMVMFAVLIMGNAHAQDDEEPTQDPYGQINITDVTVVKSMDEAGRLHGVWIWLMLSTPEDNEFCRKDTPQLIISFKIVYEIYVDEWLDASEWTGDELENCSSNGEIDTDDILNALGGKEVVAAFAQTLEPLMQHDIMPQTHVAVGGVVDGYEELHTLLGGIMDHVRSRMCYWPDPTSPTGWRWFYGCTKMQIPLAL